MTRRRTKKMEITSEIQVNDEQSDINAVETKAEETQAPAEVQLQNPEPTEIKEKATKESIEAAVKEKLSRKTDAEGADPFVPSAQLDNEVKDIANKKGFPLSRGTEIGARLMARANRII